MLRTLALITFLLLAATVQAAETEYYIGPRSGADIYERPSTQAKKIAHLDRLTSIKITSKQRTWWKIETVGRKPVVRGWITAGEVRKRYQPSVATHKSSSFFSGFASMFGHGRDTSSEKTAVLGVRGLDEETTAKAGNRNRGNTSAVRWMEGLHVSQQDVDKFIREGDLNP